MKKALILLLVVIVSGVLRAQKLDSLFFNLYTDSLKKGTHNYINVDGRLSNGTYLPLTTRELNFSSTGGEFEGNNLYIDSTFMEEKVAVRATLKSNPSVFREITIYIKKFESTEPLKTKEDVLPAGKPPRKRRGSELNLLPLESF